MKSVTRGLILGTLSASAICVTNSVPDAAEIGVISSAPFRAPYERLVPTFEKTSGHKVLTRWAPPAQIVSRNQGRRSSRSRNHVSRFDRSTHKGRKDYSKQPYRPRQVGCGRGRARGGAEAGHQFGQCHKRGAALSKVHRILRRHQWKLCRRTVQAHGNCGATEAQDQAGERRAGRSPGRAWRGRTWLPANQRTPSRRRH